MLELSKSEQGLFELLLAVVDALVELVPSPVDVSQRLLDGSGLLRCRVLR